jgi:CrcB protein
VAGQGGAAGRPTLRRTVRRGRRVLVARWDILLVVALGGALGSVARYGISRAWLAADGTFPAATFLENVSGSLLLGILMVFVLDVWPPSRYVRPFLAVGVLGGYTTFSTYMLDTRSLLAAGHAPLAAAYLFGTLAAGLLAVWVGIALGRAVTHRKETS